MKSLWLRLTVGVAVAAGAATLTEASNLVGACVVTVAAVLSFDMFRVLRRRLGLATGLASVSVCWGVLLGVAAVGARTCPGTSGGRCSSSDVAVWTASGALLPVVAAMLIATPLLMWKSVLLTRAGTAHMLNRVAPRRKAPRQKAPRRKKN